MMQLVHDIARLRAALIELRKNGAGGAYAIRRSLQNLGGLRDGIGGLHLDDVRLDLLAGERADDEHGESLHAGYALTFVGQGLDGDDEIVVFLNGRAHFLCHKF